MPPSRRPSVCACAAAVLAIAATSPARDARAQSDDGAPAPADAVERVIVTTSGAERRIADTPYAVGSVDAAELRAAGPLINLSEALSRIPGIVANNRSNYAQDLQLHSRGFGARATFGVRGLRLIADGIPASGPDGQGQVSHVDLAGAQRVEVLRGPFSALYGNSSGGVISVIGAWPTAREALLAADAGRDGLRQLRAAIAAPLAGGFSLSAGASRFATDGFRPHSEARRTLAHLRLGWDGVRDRVTVVASHLDQPALDPLGLTPAQFASDPDQTATVALPQAQPGQPGRYGTRKTTRQDQAGIAWIHRLGGDGALLESRIAAYGGTRAVTQWQSIPDAVQLPPTHPGGVIDFERRSQGLDARLLWRWTLAGERALRLTAGASTDRSAEDRRGYLNFSGSGAQRLLGVTGALRRDETNRVTSRDLYAQAEAELAPGWSATLGVRRGHVEFRSDDRYIVPGAVPGAPPLNPDDSGALAYRYTNPVASLLWRATPRLNLYLSAGHGFESPTLNELAYRPDGLTGFNDALRPQTSRQWELGAKWRPGAGRAADIAVFDARSDDEIGVLGASGGRTTFRNIGRTQRRGAELGLRWPLGPSLRSQLALTVLDARVVASAALAPGARIAGTQRGSAYAEIAWRAAPRLELALEGRAQSSVPANDANTVSAPGHGLLALRAQWQVPLGGGRLEWLLRVDNLADRRVVGSVIVNEANQRFFEPAPPRAWLVSARWTRPW